VLQHGLRLRAPPNLSGFCFAAAKGGGETKNNGQLAFDLPGVNAGPNTACGGQGP
jgi:hypothetical protein